MIKGQKYYVWVGKKLGYFFSTFNKCPVLKRNNEKLSFLGFTTDTGWPKKMSTGRLLHKPNMNQKKLG